jgi:hypothetical protein
LHELSEPLLLPLAGQPVPGGGGGQVGMRRLIGGYFGVGRLADGRNPVTKKPAQDDGFFALSAQVSVFFNLRQVKVSLFSGRIEENKAIDEVAEQALPIGGMVDLIGGFAAEQVEEGGKFAGGYRSIVDDGHYFVRIARWLGRNRRIQ